MGLFTAWRRGRRVTRWANQSLGFRTRSRYRFHRGRLRRYR
jgi:hypothetical protein